MSTDSIAWLLERLPPFERIELRGETDFYGASHVIAAQLGRPFPPPSNATWKHGWAWLESFIHPRQLAEYGGPTDTHLVATAAEVRVLKRFGYKKSYAVGMPFLYVEPGTVERRPGTLLVMPAHSLPCSEHSWDEKRYAEEMARLRPQFAQIVACLSKACVEHGYWTAAFDAVGIPWVTGASANDRNALLRMNRLFRSFDCVTTNLLGSHVAYAACAGYRVSIFGQFVQYREQDFRNAPLAAECPEVLKENLRQWQESEIRRRFPFLFVHPAQATDQRAWGAAMLGAGCQRSLPELARLLGWTPLRQFLGRHGLNGTPLARWPLVLRRRTLAAMPPLRHLYYRARRTADRPPCSESETLWRLHNALRDVPRYLPGGYRLPCGSMQYLDARVFEAQYQQIFVERCYEFRCPGDTPRILDCGGNFGLSAIWFKQRFPGCRLTVFEADAPMRAATQANLIAAGLADVELVPALTPPVLSQRISDPVDLLQLDLRGAEFDLLQGLHATGALERVNRLAVRIYRRADSQGRVPELLAQLVGAGFWYTLTGAHELNDPPGAFELTPFPAAPEARCALQLYAWKVEGQR